MRTAYRSSLDDFSQDLLAMCDSVRAAMSAATSALLRGSLQEAEDALSMSEQLTVLRSRCEERAVQLLALEAPVASDLRQVISSIYIVEDFDRMSALSMHIARAARRRYPHHAIPEELTDYFQELAHLVGDMSAKVRTLIEAPNADVAMELSHDDDVIDEINESILNRLTAKGKWDGSTAEAVDTALLLRFYERWADHCVNVAERIIFFTTGLDPEQYARRQRHEDDGATAVVQRVKTLRPQVPPGTSIS